MQVRAAAGMKVMAYKVTLQTPEGDKVRLWHRADVALQRSQQRCCGRLHGGSAPTLPAGSALEAASQHCCITCRLWSATATPTFWMPLRTRVRVCCALGGSALSWQGMQCAPAEAAAARCSQGDSPGTAGIDLPCTRALRHRWPCMPCT